MSKNRITLCVIALLVFACQEELTEVALPNNQEMIIENSSLAELIQNTVSLDGSIDNIIDNANCLLINLPVTVEINGVTVIIDSIEDYQVVEAIFDEINTDEDSVEILFPITVTLNDYTEVIIINNDELEVFKNECSSENESDNDIECIDFQYPIVFSIYNTNIQLTETVIIDFDEALYSFIENLESGVLASLNFPVTMVLSDGNIVVVNDNQELEAVIIDAKDGCEEDDDYDWDDDNCDINQVEANLLECEWTITSYNNDTGFNIFNIDFMDNGNTTITSDNESYTSDWTISLDGDIYLDFSSISGGNIQVLEGNFILVECTPNQMIFHDPINTDIELILDKDCCNNPGVLLNDLIIYMPFAEEAHDLISGFNAQNITNTFVEDRSGNSLCAMAFTGNDTFEIPVNTDNQLIQGDSFSISVWFKMQNTVAGDLEIFFRSPGNATQGFQLGVYDLNTPLLSDNLGFNLWDNDWNGEVDVVWENTDWHHLVITVDANNAVKLYRDGILRNDIGNSTISIGTQAANTYIIGEGFVGHLDDLRVYKRTLNPNEVNTLYTLDGDCYDCL
ncbi:LamG domain-containing protein [Lacinutrix sp. Bg11-31]|uniref:LamG domain-containing protein n=1 Tax=Lacinutrix sp. Bg11-31 TaxID=2057808 RepID=UPI0012FE3A3D|nr:LamG domain-containing protein [Lacinutrix sp. Bg11-31]